MNMQEQAGAFLHAVRARCSADPSFLDALFRDADEAVRAAALHPSADERESLLRLLAAATASRALLRELLRASMRAVPIPAAPSRSWMGSTL